MRDSEIPVCRQSTTAVYGLRANLAPANPQS
jgi:hypothetical protein